MEGARRAADGVGVIQADANEASRMVVVPRVTRVVKLRSRARASPRQDLAGALRRLMRHTDYVRDLDRQPAGAGALAET